MLAGVIGSVTMVMVGDDLAAGFSIWSGRTTEPAPLIWSFPWRVLIALVLLWLLGVVLQHQDNTFNRNKLWKLLCYGAASAAAILPWFQLFLLVSQT